MSLWINLAKPRNGFIRLFATLGGGNLDQFFGGISGEKAPSFMPRNQCIPRRSSCKKKYRKFTESGAREAEGRPSEVSLSFFSKVGCFIGKILGLRQTKKGVKIVATAGR